ncbi:MAG: ice-binding family protein, partial [Verrucomicrobia bacterium]|nr:ice-binding family protein [Verrucomicrobiota bacterium]
MINQTPARQHSAAYLAALALLCIPVSGYTQSILLSADQFVLLGGTAVTVAGAGPNTFSNGNVGAAVGISGFPPATVVNGSTILGGAIVNQALTDLGSARNGLNALPVIPANNLTGQDLSGMTLTPGVYKFDVAAEITLVGTKTLTLDAQGKNNVVWVINIGTSLTTAAGAKIEFINLGTNGGKDNGLFWNAGTAITFGATNVIAGNYLAGQTISFGTTVPAAGSGSGRAQSLTGVTFDGTGTMDLLGAPGGGALNGGLAINGGIISSSGYVLLGSTGTYSPGTGPLVPGTTAHVVLAPGQIYNTANLTVDGASTDTLGQAPASLTVFNTNATLTGVNSYTGGTVIDAGTLTASTANLPVNGAITFADTNATGTTSALILNEPIDATLGGAITGHGSLTKQGAGTLTLTGLNTYDAGTTVSAGNLIANSSSLPGNVALAASTGLILDQAGTGTYSGAVSGAGSLEKRGIGALTLTGVNTQTGGTTINAGTLALSGSGTLGASTSALAVNAATLDLGATTQSAGAVTLAGGAIANGTLNGTSYASSGGTVSANLGGAGVVLTQNSGTTTLTGVNTYTGGTVITGGLLVANAAALPAGQSVAIGGGGALTLNQATDASFGGVLSGLGTATKQGVGTLTLTGVNTNSGGTTVNAGTLTLSGSGTLGASTSA